MATIGIDLGTTFSAVSYVDSSGKPVILKNSSNENLTPSVIFFEDDGSFIVGSQAKEMQGFGESNIASFFKRNIGDPNFILNFHNKTYTATDLSAILLDKLKTDAEIVLGKKVDKAVITVPAYFTDPQRKETIKAAQKAGFEVLRIINEPTAAAISYALNQKGNQNILVYDLGGGTFDITILNTSENQIQVLATGGDHELGGKDWDNRIIGFVTAQFREEFGSDPLEDLVSYNDLLIRAENTKKQLSAAQSSRFVISHQGYRGTYEISRSKFEEITRDLLEKTTLKSEEILKEAKMDWNDIGGVLLVGGSTKMPMVIDWVKKISGKPPLGGVNVDEAVCLGAGIQSAIESNKDNVQTISTLGRGKIAYVKDVMSHSLGLVAENATRTAYINSIIIPKNKTIPTSEIRPYQIRTSNRLANELEVYLTQGESEKLSECKIIGKFTFYEIEHCNSGISVIDIEYHYDTNGTIKVSAKQRNNNNFLPYKEENIPDDMSWIERPPVLEEIIVPHLSLIIAIDLSGSMSGAPLVEAKKAARKFVEEIDLSNASVALLSFADTIMVNQELTQNGSKLLRNINAMSIGSVGSANDGEPFEHCLSMLNKIESPRYIIVLTDGVWSYQSDAIAKAELCSQAGIEIIAVGFGGADWDFLKKIATSDENALLTDLGGLVGSFSKIAQVLTETQGISIRDK